MANPSSGRAILVGPAVSAADLTRELRRLRPGPRDLLIGVDGGTRLWRRLGFRPDLAVGDWDSLGGQAILSGLEQLRLPRAKDRSDLHYALRAAAVAPPAIARLIALGVTGGRPDHHLASLAELTLAAGSGRWQAVSAFGPEAAYHFLSSKTESWSESVARGRVVSVFASEGMARGVRLGGLRYPLKDGLLRPSSHGLSNVTLGKRCAVSVGRGHLLVVIPRSGR